MAEAQERAGVQMGEDIRTAALMYGVSAGILVLLGDYGSQILAHAKK